jgi:hypothetical protein
MFVLVFMAVTSPGRYHYRCETFIHLRGQNPTEMFALPNPMSHVSSAAIAQARLRPGSGPAHLRFRSASGLLTLITVRDAAQPKPTSPEITNF